MEETAEKIVTECILSEAEAFFSKRLFMFSAGKVSDLKISSWLKGWICSPSFISTPVCPDGFDIQNPPETPSVLAFPVETVRKSLADGCSDGIYHITQFQGISEDFVTASDVSIGSTEKVYAAVIYARNFRRFMLCKDFLDRIQKRIPDYAIILSRPVCIGQGI